MSKGNVRRRRLIAVAGITAFLVGAGAGAAFAGTAVSATGYFSVAGVSYYDYATVYTSSGSALASTRLAPTSGTVPVGWGGANARLFTSGGSLACESGFAYNSVVLTTSTVLNPFSCTKTGSGIWYSYGVVKGFTNTGGTYNAYYTYVSPNQNS